MNSNTYKIKNIGAGSKFVYGGVSWVLLQKSKAAALCLAEKILFEKAFDDDSNNNFAESTLYKHLNSEFLDQLAADGADKDAFLPFKLDLTADDGLKDYGSVTGKVSLITCDLYRKHRYIIPNADGWWWTATPYSTASNGYSYIVRNVIASGALDYHYANYGSYGVRPLCNLASSLLVSVTDLKDYTPDEEAESKPEPAEPKKETRHEETRKLHTAAIKRAYEALDKMQTDFMTDGGTDGDIEKITAALAMLQAVTQIELTDEEKAELQQAHAETVKRACECVQLSFDLYINKEEKSYPEQATQALAMLKQIIG